MNQGHNALGGNPLILIGGDRTGPVNLGDGHGVGQRQDGNEQENKQRLFHGILGGAELKRAIEFSGSSRKRLC